MMGGVADHVIQIKALLGDVRTEDFGQHHVIDFEDKLGADVAPVYGTLISADDGVLEQFAGRLVEIRIQTLD